MTWSTIVAVGSAATPGARLMLVAISIGLLLSGPLPFGVSTI